MCKSERFICPSFLARGHEDCEKAHKAWKVNCSRAGSYSARVSCRWVFKWRRKIGKKVRNIPRLKWEWAAHCQLVKQWNGIFSGCSLLLVTTWGKLILPHRRYKHPGLKRIHGACQKAPYFSRRARTVGDWKWICNKKTKRPSPEVIITICCSTFTEWTGCYVCFKSALALLALTFLPYCISNIFVMAVLK